MTMKYTDNSVMTRRQQGAALVVSLILLMMLTLLAVSTMRTASLEVAMAGNDQFGENAFQLAETANEQYMRTVETNSACVDEQNDGICDIGLTAVAQMGGSFQAVNNNIPNEDPPCALSSIDEGIRFDFEVQLTGNASDNAVSTHTQGWSFCNP